MPMPTLPKAGRRMFARCPGEAMKGSLWPFGLGYTGIAVLQKLKQDPVRLRVDIRVEVARNNDSRVRRELPQTLNQELG